MFKKILAVLLVFGLALPAAIAQDEELPDKIVLGMVPSREAGAIVDSLEPIAQMLEQRLLIPVEPFVATSYVGVVEALGSGRVDLAMLGPAAMVQAHDRYGAEIILASVRFGSNTYKSQFNIRCDSGIDSFDDLEGKTIAFVDVGSASGYQFPYVFLKNQHGINPDNDMTQIFAGSHDAAVLTVYQGDADVGVSFNDARESIEDDFPDVKEQVCILGYTQDIPNDGVVVRGEFSDEVTQQIQQALIDIVRTEEGQALFSDMINVTDYAPITAEPYGVVRDVSQEFQR